MDDALFYATIRTVVDDCNRLQADLNSLVYIGEHKSGVSVSSFHAIQLHSSMSTVSVMHHYIQVTLTTSAVQL